MAETARIQQELKRIAEMAAEALEDSGEPDKAGRMRKKAQDPEISRQDSLQRRRDWRYLL